MTNLSLGNNAPDFTLPSTCGKEITLSELRGSTIVLYFYPKDDTIGCTTEAIDFSKLNNEFKKESAVVIGISPDTITSHDKFCKKHDLSIKLLSDESKISLNAYGVWKEKSMFGKKYMGVERTTVLIDKNGIVSKIWNNVKVKGHANEVLNYLKNLYK
ncbi:thioredoxin-dependent thiol peroxidase [Candidatus Liberibacter americanus]|uniref:thioredoxin-dependent peroxiredoxin n=1 Tax=Candidatus Liberibacter americanus str. Sao Paulo TaxID=1261131 RepID=U6B5B1_9HYPH|nr:thioredoxin-dependent thiol peroxidase [Candidatus Liberibacter americanus]AHA27793.1 Peroxiredoxin [Candidatus Liberibacter americanus str. Sao Paulo]EMS36177.1 bacterioferritin comigratory protein [Candidatus Liberibacter americanus PW_SP]